MSAANQGRVFVTGVAGMIGSNLAGALLDAGRHVIGIDNLWRGTRANIAGLLLRKEFSFRHADVASDHEWYADLGHDDQVIHVADIVAGIEYVFGNEWAVFNRNIMINSGLARAVRERKPSRLIYLGTACSYPQQMQRSVERSVLAEKDKFPADPESGYGWSKLVGEIEFRLALKGLRTKYITLDLHNVYGWPCIYSDRTAQVIPSLINRALRSPGKPLTVWGDGSQGRAFVHVRDVVQAIVLALGYEGSESTFMIGPAYCTTIREVAELVSSHPKVKCGGLEFDVTKPTGDLGRFANPALAEQELRWKPTVSIKDGIWELIDRIAAHA